MGGHGGLNILPQKRWNVYNYDNREKVRRDEENAAKEEQIKREEARRCEADHRLQQLRRSRGLPGQKIEGGDAEGQQQQKEVQELHSALGVPPTESESNRHVNLFEGIRIFDPITSDDLMNKKRRKSDGNDSEKVKKMKKKMESEVRAVGPEDEKYRMGYGVCGKGVKLPWYMEKKKLGKDSDDSDDSESKSKEKGIGNGNNRKKSLEELREERLARERTEKERERALLSSKSKNRNARR